MQFLPMIFLIYQQVENLIKFIGATPIHKQTIMPECLLYPWLEMEDKVDIQQLKTLSWLMLLRTLLFLII